MCNSLCLSSLWSVLLANQCQCLKRNIAAVQVSVWFPPPAQPRCWVVAQHHTLFLSIKYECPLPVFCLLMNINCCLDLPEEGGRWAPAARLKNDKNLTDETFSVLWQCANAARVPMLVKWNKTKIFQVTFSSKRLLNKMSMNVLQMFPFFLTHSGGASRLSAQPTEQRLESRWNWWRVGFRG